jgi:glutathione S-transferase
MSLVLHALPPSANSSTVRALLKVAGIDFSEVNCYGQTRSEKYVSKFPTNLAPALEHGDFCVSESTAIMKYVAGAFKEKAGKFYPDDVKQRATVDMLCAYVEGSIYPLIAKAVYPNLGFPLYAGDVASLEETKPNAGKSQEAAGAELSKLLKEKFSDKFLSKTKYLLSDVPTVADFRFAPVLLFAKIGVVMPERLDKYLEDMNKLAGYTEAVAPVLGFAQDKFK